MKQIIRLLMVSAYLFFLAGIAQAQPVDPVGAIRWINPADHLEGVPLTDLASVTVECTDGVTTYQAPPHPTTEPGGADSIPMPAEVAGMVGLVTCTAWATTATGDTSPRSPPVQYACTGGACYPKSSPGWPVLSEPSRPSSTPTPAP